jgi:tellurite resistance protein TerC
LQAIPGFHAEAAARQVTLEYLTGYIIEEALSVDNLFVFVVIFGSFAIPPAYQHRILFLGILGAILFRGAFIAAGAVLFSYHWVAVAFGLLLMVSGVKLAFVGDQPDHPEDSRILAVLRRYLPVTPSMASGRFLVRDPGRRGWVATPLLLVLVLIECTDVLFAADSVPAIFAITREPLIVFTSNIFAILGLRSLYFLLAGAVERFHLLRYGLAFVLVFVGLKMVWLNQAFGGKFPIGWSLGIISGAIGISIGISLLWPMKDSPEDKNGA